MNEIRRITLDDGASNYPHHRHHSVVTNNENFSNSSKDKSGLASDYLNKSINNTQLNIASVLGFTYFNPGEQDLTKT